MIRLGLLIINDINNFNKQSLCIINEKYVSKIINVIIVIKCIVLYYIVYICDIYNCLYLRKYNFFFFPLF